MKNKNNKLLFLIIAGLVIILIVILILQNRRGQETPSDSTPEETQAEFELNNAFPIDQPVLNDQETQQLDAVTQLKNLSPVTTPDFTIEYSYQTGNFLVKSAKNLNATEKDLQIWLNNNGLTSIPAERFEYQSSKLAL